MTNLEINQKLAEAMGIRVSKSKQSDCLWIENGEMTDIWDPVHDMTQAWEVAERFNLRCLDAIKDKWKAILLIDNKWVVASADTAPFAICKAALKVIRGEK